ncbi:unnamed protein product, partial [Ectocarpus sp. 12 AP-2014]
PRRAACAPCLPKTRDEIGGKVSSGKRVNRALGRASTFQGVNNSGEGCHPNDVHSCFNPRMQSKTVLKIHYMSPGETIPSTLGFIVVDTSCQNRPLSPLVHLT